MPTCPNCDYYRATARDGWDQHRDRCRELCEANRRIDDMRFTIGILCWFILLIATGCNGRVVKHSLTTAPTGSVVPVGNDTVRVESPTTRRFYRVGDDGRLTPIP